eukprot:11117864-Karenia_brevis.AAC.1
MEYGIMVGVNRKSNEFLISTVNGISKCRTIKRIPKEERWGDEKLRWVKWAPWKKYEGDEEADGDVPEGVNDDERESSNKEQKEEAKKDR